MMKCFLIFFVVVVCCYKRMKEFGTIVWHGSEV